MTQIQMTNNSEKKKLNKITYLNKQSWEALDFPAVKIYLSIIKIRLIYFNKSINKSNNLMPFRIIMIL